MGKQSVWILDDDKNFRLGLKDALHGSGLDVAAFASQQEMYNALSGTPPDDLLLDFSSVNDSIRDFLREMSLPQSVFWNCRVWIISGIDTVNITKLQAVSPRVQPRWFAKPIKIGEIVATLTNSYTPAPELAFLPVPLRVLDAQGNVLYCNPLWRSAANRPDPAVFLIPAITEPKEFWGALPQDPDEFGYFKVLTSPDLSGNLIQVAERLNYLFLSAHESEKQGTIHSALDAELNALIDKGFAAMQQAGFVRARFYRVFDAPDSSEQTHGLLVLVKHHGAGVRGTREDRILPLDGAIWEKLESYRTQSKKNSLIYRIFRKEEENQQDPGNHHWNHVVSAEGLESWLEVPVLRNLQGKCQITALFIFDRLGATGLQDGKAESVTDTQVRAVEKMLLNFVREAVALRQRIEDVDQMQWHKKLDLYESILGPTAGDKTKLESTLLDFAITVTRAKSGMIVTPLEGMDMLECVATTGLDDWKGVRIPMDAEKFHIVRCAKTGESFSIPDYLKLPEDQKPQEADWQRIKSGDSNLLKTPFVNIRSKIVLPIVYGEKEILSIIVLRHPKPYKFIQRRLEKLDELLKRARWYLHGAVSNERRKMWEYAVMHELRSDAKVIDEGASVLDEEELSHEQQIMHARIKRHGKKLLDMSNDFLTLLNAAPSTQQWGGFEHPCAQINEFLELYQEPINWRGLKVDKEKIDLSFTLKGAREVFRRVVYNLLHNAQKFALKDSVIHVRAELLDKFWQLVIENSGEMTTEEEETLFQPFRKSRTARHDGAHIGLAASKSLVEQVGGKLSVRNTIIDDLSWVCATLDWPLQEKVE